MHYPKSNELSKLQGFILVKYLTLGNCNIIHLLQYQPCNLKVHMCTGTDCINIFLLTFPKGFPGVRIFPAICNGIKTSKQRIKIKALKAKKI